MNHTEATQYIKATLAVFGPSEAISFTQDTWAKIYKAMSVLFEQQYTPALTQPLTVDCIGLALDLEAQAKRVESQTVERAMLAAANGLRIIASHVI